MERIYLTHNKLWNQELVKVKGFHSTDNAQVYKCPNGDLLLFSYKTLIARITLQGELQLTYYHDYSSTTHKHVIKFTKKYLGAPVYSPERKKLVKENGYLGQEIEI